LQTVQVPVLADRDPSRKPRIIDLHQDMLSGVQRLAGDFPVYGSTYLEGPSRAQVIWSSLYPLTEDSSLLDQLDAHAGLLETCSSSLRLVTTVADLDADDPRTGVLPHSEGFHLPGIGPDSLDTLWSQHSLRSLGLTWNYETDYGYSCYDDKTAPLKPVGRKLVRSLAQSPLMLDLAHLNEAGYYETLELFEPPLLVTHSFCRAIGDHPRGLTDDQLLALGQHGGLIGLAFDPDFLGSGSVNEALQHIDRIASLAGESAVSIGSDWGVAAMGELGDHTALVRLLEAVESIYGADLAEKFAFANAYDFLCAQLPAAE
jgi:membrane dipeptidase